MTGVVITGMGAVSAAGLGVASLWEAARDGVSKVGPLSLPRGESLRIRIAASVPDFDPTRHIDEVTLRRCDRFTQFSHIAAAEAIAQSGIAPDELAGERTGAIFGSGIGGMSTVDEGCYLFYCSEQRPQPMAIPKLMPSSAVSDISITHEITGPCFAVTSACASASQSIGVAMQLIRAGIIDRAIAGGSEACLTPVTIRAWEMLRVLSPNACRPFARTRNGMVIGEGAGAFVLESEAAAARRGATPLARLVGYGTASDSRDIIQPDVGGASAAMRAALSDAGLAPEDIGYVNAHGTGTVLNDINESAAIREVFGAYTDSLPVSSTKPVIGHTLGASGALELAVAIMALREQIIPPQINCTEPDPKCPLNLPTNGAVAARLGAVMSNSFAFGGINATLIATPAS